jgi:hypothetical protein
MHSLPQTNAISGTTSPSSTTASQANGLNQLATQTPQGSQQVGTTAPATANQAAAAQASVRSLVGPTLAQVTQVDLTTNTAHLQTSQGTLAARIDHAATATWLSAQRFVTLVPTQSQAHGIPAVQVHAASIGKEHNTAPLQTHLQAQRIFLAAGAPLSAQRLNGAVQAAAQTPPSVTTPTHRANHNVPSIGPHNNQALGNGVPSTAILQAHATLAARDLPVTPALVRLVTPTVAPVTVHNAASTSSTNNTSLKSSATPATSANTLVNASNGPQATLTTAVTNRSPLQTLLNPLPNLPAPQLSPWKSNPGWSSTTTAASISHGNPATLPTPSASTPPDRAIAELTHHLRSVLGQTNHATTNESTESTAANRPGTPDFLRAQQESLQPASLRDFAQANLQPPPGWQDYSFAVPLFVADHRGHPQQRGWLGVGEQELGSGDDRVVFVRCDLNLEGLGATSIRLAVPDAGPGSGTLVVEDRFADPAAWSTDLERIAEETGIHFRVRPWHPDERGSQNNPSNQP